MKKRVSAMMGVAAMSVAMISQAHADAVKVGLHETGGVHVESGTVTQSDPVVLGDKAKFYKTGAGELVLPLANVNRQRDYSLAALDGKMTISAGDDSTVDVSQPPAVLSRAAFWVNVDSAVTDENGLVTKWCDVRETTPESPKCYYAVPAWSSKATTYANVPPKLATFHGRQGVYFYGRQSNVFMKFFTNGTDSAIGAVRHVFLVHGVTNCWGAAVGYGAATSVSRQGGMVPGTGTDIVDLANCPCYFVRRSDLSSDFYSGRFYLNGQLFDPFTTAPKRGVSLLECDFLARPSMASRFFRTGFETYTGNQGGDYICEVVIFTGTLLSEKDRLDVERYLLKKWSLPYHATSSLRLPMTCGTVGVASNAKDEVSAASGEQTTPLTFSGEGTVRKTGAGAMLVGPASDTPFSGTFTLEEGSVISAGGRPPAVEAMSGDVYDSSRYQHNNSSTPDDIAKSGMRLTRATDGARGVFRKTGAGEVRVSGIDAGVNALNVEGGVVTLETRSKVAHFAPCETVITASVPNASFEMPFTNPYSDGRKFFTTSLNGWEVVVDQGAYISVDNPGWSNWAGELPPDGRNVLGVRGGTSVQTTVTFPKAGRYELTIWACDRYGQQSGNDSYGVSQINLCLVKPDSSLVQVGTVLPYGRRFVKHRFMLPAVAAGDYKLRLASPIISHDDLACVDDIRITYVGECGENEVFKIPNGDFEKLSPRTSHPTRYGFFTTLDRAEGWTFEIANASYASCLTNYAVGLTSPSKHLKASCQPPLYSYMSGKLGSVSLAFVHGNGRASTTFTVPAGTYRLRCNAAWTPVNTQRQKSNGTWQELDANGQPNIAARLEAGGASVSLGTITPGKVMPYEMLWPTAVSFAVPTEVTLVLEQSNTGASGTVDDLVLVSEDRLDSGNLLKDGGFESMTSWTVTANTAYYKYSQCSALSYAASPTWAYGYNVFEGNNRAAFKNESLMTQTVSFPAAGLYRFRLHANTRIDNGDCGQNPFRFWYHAAGSAETNVIDVMRVPRCLNWFEREYLFGIPAAGNYKFGIEGGYSLRTGGYGIQDTSTNADRFSFIDGCSIRRVTDDLHDAPKAPSKMKITVASGSRLVLNYPGSLQVGRVRLGDTVISKGVVNAETHPQFIGGMGSLNVVPGGLVIQIL